MDLRRIWPVAIVLGGLAGCSAQQCDDVGKSGFNVGGPIGLLAKANCHLLQDEAKKGPGADPAVPAEPQQEAPQPVTQ